MFVGCFMLRSLLLLLSLKQTSISLFVNGLGSAAGAGEEGSREGNGGSSSRTGEEISVSDGYLIFYKNPSLTGHRVLTGIYQTRTVTSLMDCLLQCTDEIRCTSINYEDRSTNLNCDLLDAGDADRDEMVGWEIAEDAEYSHYTIQYEYEEMMHFCSSNPCPGNSTCHPESETCSCVQGYSGEMCDQAPPATCYDVGIDRTNPESGSYWIQPHPKSPPIYVYCDLETKEGFWTLVYSYTFTNYSNFFTLANAVTPRPNWPASQADVPISTSPPTNDNPGAVDYSLWEHIGSNFLIKSNINDWIYCTPGSGSLVIQKNGTIYCSNIKNVTSACSGFAPGKITWMTCGPKIFGRNTMYRFDGCTTNDWPTHNPCENTWRDNQKMGVVGPYGSIYLRP